MNEKRLKRIEDQEKISRDGIRHEDELISKRLTWMTTVQGFLFSAVGISLVNSLNILFIQILGSMGIAISISTLLTIYRGHTAIELYIRRWQLLQLKLIIDNIPKREKNLMTDKDWLDFIEKYHRRINPNAIIIGYNSQGINNRKHQKPVFLSLLLEICSIFLHNPLTLDFIKNNINEDFQYDRKEIIKINKQENKPDRIELENYILKKIGLENDYEKGFSSSLIEFLICFFSPPRGLPIIFGVAWVLILLNLDHIGPSPTAKNKIEFNSNSPLEIKIIIPSPPKN